ncbi:3-oxoacyl-synthase [Hyphopichia burtonii NRRL Y-1933]|uniref:3-oxoacyl-[acyl-carrier-protein] synthase n=1 Tax=Hyphopichia burtonii NRRL Y-1933 TaxID=984485 RepID=A0A1E4RGT3_9ASCO|nr:3-oxoacyl-synthase [Hyphopichia burtonii NRRL Y-1933]ODV66473.1 3-oxoacyl-synthase [Hyphopichia burtonii NRRL Y-1933]
MSSVPSAASRVVVTGLGLVTPLGVGLKHNWQGILDSSCGIISTTSFPDYETAGWDKIPAKVYGKVPRGSLKDGKWDPLDYFELAESRRLGIFSQFAIAAADEAIKDSKLDLNNLDRERIGITVGSGVGSFDDICEGTTTYDAKGYKRMNPLFVPKLLINMAAGNISIRHGIKGPLHTASTACATGLHSIGDAYNFIKNDYADVMVAGASESVNHPLGLSGFARARSLVTDFNDDPSKASRPFDASRSGFVLGEGSGVLILERLSNVLERGAQDQIYGEVLGYGLSGDAHHITAPATTGDGAYRAMVNTLKRAKLNPNDIDYINAHATSTVLGDRAENNAINNLFGDHKNLSISSTKSAIGHLLGAAGSVEAIYAIKGLKENILPPTINLEKVGGHPDDDPEKFNKFDYVPNVARSKEINYALCNSFGFGGVNASIVFGKYNS